jgi:SAM-dependent methyltransferase
MRIPTRLDRYPAKMVSKLADHLVERYALRARHILDPFCGSGAILIAAKRRGIAASGIDINPVAELFCKVKLNGFNSAKAFNLAQTWIREAKKAKRLLPIQWDAKHYWFTPATIIKYERLRFASKELNLSNSDEGIAVLLSYTLTIRSCSRADQRSPKPFISKQAKKARSGKHFDPYQSLMGFLEDLSTLYGKQANDLDSQFLLEDILNTTLIVSQFGMYSHIITSPPYINAQDYFRNFKLELYLLEDILPLRVDELRERFIGTERGNLLHNIPKESLKINFDAFSGLKDLEMRDSRLAAVVHRYFYDMRRAFDTAKRCLEPNGCFVLVCGDNLIRGLHIPTWRILQNFLEELGFKLFDRFSDQIRDRLLAPKRYGHKGL